jgi:hypothetical protein
MGRCAGGDARVLRCLSPTSIPLGHRHLCHCRTNFCHAINNLAYTQTHPAMAGLPSDTTLPFTEEDWIRVQTHNFTSPHLISNQPKRQAKHIPRSSHILSPKSRKCATAASVTNSATNTAHRPKLLWRGMLSIGPNRGNVPLVSLCLCNKLEAIA